VLRLRFTHSGLFTFFNELSLGHEKELGKQRDANGPSVFQRESDAVSSTVSPPKEHLQNAREKSKAWQDDDNHHRPHGSLGHLTPSEFVSSGSVQPKEAASPSFRTVRFPGERQQV